MITYLAIATVYLTVCVLTLKSSNEVIPQPSKNNHHSYSHQFRMVEGEDGQMYEEETIQMCEVDSNLVMTYFIYFQLIPNLIIRLHAWFKYRHRDPIDFNEYNTYIQVFYHGNYGLWTIFNIVKYLKVSQSCKEVKALSMVNY